MHLFSLIYQDCNLTTMVLFGAVFLCSSLFFHWILNKMYFKNAEGHNDR